VTHYKGQCLAWDVVNEALDDSGGFRTSVFYNVLGSSYIPIAFKAAAAADPAAKLYYNDYNIEASGAKQQAVIGIINLIKNSGARIDGVGLQAHLIVGSTPSRSALASVLNSYVSAGVSEVAYTELDIRFTSLPSTTSGQQQQAVDYVNVVGACLDVKACVGVTIWDFTDKYSWIPSTFSGQGDACLFSSNLVPKPAYTSVSSLLAAAAATGSVPTQSSTTLVTSTRTSSTVVATPTGALAQRWGQCGGNGWVGPTQCVSPWTCTFVNDWYSQCL
jgi:endo-1,4-beta-xylanase